jgi:hypothetical protein
MPYFLARLAVRWEGRAVAQPSLESPVFKAF